VSYAFNRDTLISNCDFRKAKEALKKIMSHELNDTTFEILLAQLNKFSESVEDYRDTVCNNTRRVDTKSTRKISQVSKKSLHQYTVCVCLYHE
jgi:hypothetical protein